jgi:hypothetical protein
VYPHTTTTDIGILWGTLTHDTKGSNKQITVNKAFSLHDALSKRKKGNCRKAGNVILVLSQSKQGEMLWKWKDPFCAEGNGSLTHRRI